MAYRLKNLRILVVDGNTPIRALIRTLLLELGFGKVDTARDMKYAWAEYQENKPDVILLDWRLYDIDVIDFIRKVRTHRSSHNKQIPIIVMTGQTNHERVVYARDIGATEFLIKPFSITTLVKYFTSLIEKPRDFVMAKSFVGPDRRRREGAATTSKRKSDKTKGKA